MKGASAVATCFGFAGSARYIHEGAYNARVRRLALVLAVATTLSPAAAAQRTEPLTASRVRALAIEAEAEGKGDKTEIVLALDRKFRQHWGDFESFPISILKREDLTIVLSLPFMTYRRTLVEYLRMEKPLAE